MLSFPATIQANGAWIIERSHANISVGSDGKVTVHETVRANFQESQKTGITRTIPLRYVDGKQLDFVELEMKKVQRNKVDEPYRMEEVADATTIVVGDERLTLSGAQEYIFEYVLSGAARKSGKNDSMMVQVTGGWETAVQQSTATITLPKGGLLGQACSIFVENGDEDKDGCKSVGMSDSVSRYAATGTIPAYGSMLVRAEFDRGLVPITSIQPPTIRDWLDIYRQPLLIASGVIAALALLIAWRYFRIQAVEKAASAED